MYRTDRFGLDPWSTAGAGPSFGVNVVRVVLDTKVTRYPLRFSGILLGVYDARVYLRLCCH